MSNIETDMQLVSAGFCPCEDRVRDVRARAYVPHNHPTIYRQVWYAFEGFVLVNSVHKILLLWREQYWALKRHAVRSNKVMCLVWRQLLRYTKWRICGGCSWDCEI